MPYVACTHCGFESYSAAGHAGVDECLRCGWPLPTGTRSARPPEPEAPAIETIDERIERRLGRFPAFLEPVRGNPRIVAELWRQTQAAWLDGDVPAHIRHRLLAALTVLAPWPWSVVSLETGAVPEHLDAAQLLEQAPRDDLSPLQGWPEPGSSSHDEVISVALGLMLGRRDPERCRRLQQLLGAGRYASLMAALAFLQSCRLIVEAHPGLAPSLSEMEPRLRRDSDHGEAAVLEVDAGGRIRGFSAAAAALFGWSPDEAAEKAITDLFAEEFAEPLARLVGRLLESSTDARTQQTLQVVGRRADGTFFDAALTLVNRRRGDRRGATGIVVDTTSWRRSAQYAAAFHALLAVTAHADSPRETALLAALAESLGCEAAALWRYDADAGVLRCEPTRPQRPGDPGAARLRSLTREPGEPIAGAVFASGEPVWITDLPHDPNAEAAAAETLPGTSTAVWLRAGLDDPSGVIQLMSSRATTHDPVLLELLAGLAAEVWSRLGAGEEHEAGAQMAGPVLAFEGAPIGMALVDMRPGHAGRITQANQALANLTSMRVEQLTDVRLDDLFHSDDPGAGAELMEQLITGRIPSYQALRCFKRGPSESFWGEMSVSLIRDADSGRPLYAVVQVADVTDHKRAEDAVYASRDQFANAFEEALVGLAIASLEMQWLQVNSTLCEVLGYDEPELLTKTLADLVHPDDLEKVMRYQRDVASGTIQSYHLECRAVTATDDVIWVQLGVSLVHDYGDTPAYVVAEVQDITERKRLEVDLARGVLHDDVTGLPSRALLMDRLEQARSRLHRTGHSFAVILVDVDGFARVNHAFGRSRGDQVLREIAARIGAATRDGDTVARYGNDEYVAVCEDIEDRDEAVAIAERVLELGQMTVGTEPEAVEVGLTVGVLVCSDPDDGADALLDAAQAALLAAKRSGSDLEYATRASWERDLGVGPDAQAEATES